MVDIYMTIRLSKNIVLAKSYPMNTEMKNV